MKYIKTINYHFVGSFSLSFIARLLGIINILIIIPLIINNYDAEEFALFSIVTQFITIYGFLDLGIGHILINEIVLYRNKNYLNKLKTVIVQSFKFLLLISLFVIVLLVVYYYTCGLGVLENKFSKDIVALINSNYLKFICLFCLVLPTTLIQKIQFGFLDNMRFHFFEIIQKMLQIIAIYVLVSHQYSILDLIYYYYLVILITNLINIVYYFFIVKKDYFKKGKILNKNLIPGLVKKSFYFFLGSIFFFFSRTLDTYLISVYGSFEALKDYEIIKRPFDIGLTTVMIITSVLWPMLTEASHKKQFSKIKKILNQTFLGVFVIMFLLSLSMLLFGNELLKIWINDKTIFFSNRMFILTGLVFMMYAVGNILVTYLNSISVFLVQLIIYIALTLIGIPFKIKVLNDFGLEGYFVLLSILLLVLYVLPMYIISFKKLNLIKT